MLCIVTIRMHNPNQGNENNGKFIEFSRTVARRVLEAVRGGETFGMYDACDAAIFIQHVLPNILKNTVKIKILIDGETIIILIINNEFKTERRLMIDIKTTREVLNEGIVNDVNYIRRWFNVTDAMTMHATQPQPVHFLHTLKVQN